MFEKGLGASTIAARYVEAIATSAYCYRRPLLKRCVVDVRCSGIVARTPHQYN